MPALKVKEAAIADLANIVNYITADNPIAAQTLDAEIRDKISALPDHPRLYRPGKLPGTREMIIRRRYIVVYTETPETVTVLRVLHAARQWP